MNALQLIEELQNLPEDQKKLPITYWANGSLYAVAELHHSKDQKPRGFGISVNQEPTDVIVID